MLYKQPNLEFIAEKIPETHYTNLYDYVLKRREDNTWNMNSRLAGALMQQSSLSEWKIECPGFEEYLLSLSCNIWTGVYQTCPWDFEKIKNPTEFMKLRNLWVNYQRKGEYNPIHTHSGIVSFVVFVDIPYGEEERSMHKTNGTFQLEAEVLPVDKSWNGVIIMFPASTKHAVYPYQSTDKERITVSGNIFWNVGGVDEEHC